MTEINRDISKNHFLYHFLNPESIAVFGASNSFLDNMGAMMLRNIIFGGFPKERIYPIHPKLENIQGLKAHKSILDLSEVPDLAFIILRPYNVPKVLEECGEKGVKRAIIVSGGFREFGSDGIQLSNKILNIARKYDIRFIGPNCLGVYNAFYNYPEFEDKCLNTMWIYETPERGNISIIAHSGTVASHVFWYCNRIGVKIGKSLSAGNEENIDLVDFLDYLKDDPETDVIGLYIEEIKRGKEFIDIAKKITSVKPIVAIYAGGTEAASRSIMGHTGSIAGDNKIFEAVFKETGIISTDSIKEFFYYLRTFSTNIIPNGNRLGIITDSGGCGAMMAKSAEKLGLIVPEFSDELKSKLKPYVPPVANIDNPLDLTFQFNQYNLYVKIPKAMINSGEIDAIIMYAAFGFKEILEVIKISGGKTYEEFEVPNHMLKGLYLKPIQRLVKKKEVPVFYIGPQGYSNPWVQEFIKSNIPIFDLWDMPVKCFSVLAKYSEYRKKLNPNFKI
ncbi:MAG: CoA-binding protein [Candidatus Lokiarchaeota archaeon]|nr:CoA-binding protein [Candidatus Lokiarchaeota archaeon]